MSETKKTTTTKKQTTAAKKPAAAKKSAAKKAPAKKPAAKKTTTAAKKPAAKKAPAKKLAAKKAPAKKPTAKKPAAKKAPAKKKSAQQVAADAAKAAKKGDVKFGITKTKKSKGQKLSLKDRFSDFKKDKKPKKPELVEVKKGKSDYKKNRAKRAEVEWRNTIIKRTFAVIGICIATFVIVFGIFSLAGKTTVNGGIAASIDDYKIMEKDVTNYITYNTYYGRYSKDKNQWAQLVNAYFGGSEKFRQSVIEDKFVHDELVRRAADKEGIEVTDEEVDEHVQNLRNKYKNEDAYKNALAQKGETPESYWNETKQSLLDKKLKAKVCPDKTVSDDDLVKYIDTNKTAYQDAKRSSHILINGNEFDKAQEILGDINNGKIDFAAAAKKYSIDTTSAENGGDVGWDKINSFVNEYQTALNNLEVGQVSDVVKTQYGYHIIKCTDKWTPGEKVESLAGIPEDIVKDCREKKKEQDQEADFKTYLDGFKTDNGIEVTIYPMPADVPYYAPPSAAKTPTTTTTAAQ